jgi:hypothetical protein
MGDRQAGAAIALNKRGSLMDPAAATLSSSRCDCLADVRDGVGILRGLTNVPRLSLTQCMVLYQTPEHVLQHPAA